MASQEETVKSEIEALESFELFQRSPNQLKILKYLGERASDPSRGSPTQYDIATEALGRHESFDQSEDSSVRVQVSRLRRNLEAYYAVNKPVGEAWAYIPAGSYRLKCASLSIAYPKLAPQTVHQPPTNAVIIDEVVEKQKNGLISRVEASTPFAIRRKVFALGATAAFATLAITGYSLRPSASPELITDDAGIQKPSVSYSVQSVGYNDQSSKTAQIEGVVASEVEQRIARSIIAAPTETDGDFHLTTKIDTFSSGQRMLILEVTRKNGAIFYHDEVELPENPDDARAVVGWRVAKLVSPPGLISRALVDEVPAGPRNSFECFIFVELGRSHTGSSKTPLEVCKEEFPKGEYYPYLAARDLFLKFQAEMVADSQISEDGTNWKKMGDLLRTYPENPYLNAVAAKALYSKESCAAAKDFEGQALLRGHDYPALELALIVEAYACLEDQSDERRFSERIREVVEAQDSPHPLLEVYALTAIALSDQSELVGKLGDKPFGYGEETPTVELIAQLRGKLTDKRHDIEDTQTFRAFVWSTKSREKVLRAKQQTL